MCEYAVFVRAGFVRDPEILIDRRDASIYFPVFIHPVNEVVRRIVVHGDQQIFFRAPVGWEIEWHFLTPFWKRKQASISACLFPS